MVLAIGNLYIVIVKYLYNIVVTCLLVCKGLILSKLYMYITHSNPICCFMLQLHVCVLYMYNMHIVFVHSDNELKITL